MRFRSRVALATPILLALVASPLAAQSAGDLALVFAYRPHPGEGALFEAGYRRHLAWHAEREDPLPWFAWTVTIGERRGLFVDGTFGITARAFAARVDPAGDRADFLENADPFADPVASRVWRLRPDLGTARPLEERTPPASLLVFHVEVRPGDREPFERWAAGESASADAPRTWYEVVAGDERPAYALMVPMEGWIDLDDPGAPDFDGAGASIRRVWSEVWTYRPDLSLFSDPRTGRNP